MYYWSAEGGDTGSAEAGAGASETAGGGEVERGVSVSTLKRREELPDSMAGWCRLVKRFGELIKIDVRYPEK